MHKDEVRKLPEALHRVCRSIAQAGGRAWLVGGSVRDMLLGHPPKDFDLEVFGLDQDALMAALNGLGHCKEVGRQFGVVKLWTEQLEIDLALPRTERKTGSGHCGFSVRPEPMLDPQSASLRRDFTINAMMLDPLSAELLDFHHGQHDLEQGLLRHVSPAFAEDPLRPLRAMQFAARFHLHLDAQTAALCRSMTDEARSLPAARIWQEWRKWAHAPHPSFGLRVLQDCGWIACYPELEALVACRQDPEWHPEGDVWTHTALVVDCAAHAARQRDWQGGKREILLLAALCHDLGKPATTFKHESGRIRSTGHAEDGIEACQSFLNSISAPQRHISHILPLVLEHLVHLHGKPSPRAVRRLAHRLQPSDIAMWEALVEADASGRDPLPAARPALPWLEEAHAMQVQHSAPEPLTGGAMLIKMGMLPGPDMGRLLHAAYQAQLDGEYADIAGAQNWLSRHLPKH
ncbi:MAG: HDIG domain-containing protein [Mariprofundaceae bacterium]|nr:HDIG domain-containing protein [Mariprofundaceae bacterium]